MDGDVDFYSLSFTTDYFQNIKENNKLLPDFLYYLRTQSLTNIQPKFTLSEIVHRSAISKTSFCTIFHSIVGMPFKEYLNRYRIERAAELLAEGAKISAAASCCGYSDFSTFYRNFKKHMGVSPSEFAHKNK